MSQSLYNTITALIFLIVAAFHLLRIILGWPVQIAQWGIPLWVSWIALIVAGALALIGFRPKV